MNTLKSFLLISALTGLLIWIGFAVAGELGLVLGLGVGLVMNGVAYFFSDSIVLASYGARVVSREEAPMLFDIVATLAQRAGLPMPRIAIIPEETPNAFATGRNPEHAVVAVTEGILGALSRQELEGVLAHELGHVKHRDILLGSMASVLAQAIMFLSQMAYYITPRDEEDRPNPLLGLVIMIFGPLAALLLQMALSRSREYMADAYAAHLTGRPDMLASALERIANWNAQAPLASARPATAHMMIVNPLSGGGLMSLFSTHPPLLRRIERLNAMPIEAR
ncbi:MAG: M48 family metalloprotease [Acidobacteria bacterium]|nr:M48 family metalloprotease [Acidobacteriota bacterium]